MSYVALACSVIKLIEGCPGVPQGDMSASINRLANNGILVKNGSLVLVSHDLIYEQVMESMAIEHRRYLQHSIGTFLISKTDLDLQFEVPVETSIEQLNISNNPQDDTVVASPLLIAVDLINGAGPMPNVCERTPSKYTYCKMEFDGSSKNESSVRLSSGSSLLQNGN